MVVLNKSINKVTSSKREQEEKLLLYEFVDNGSLASKFHGTLHTCLFESILSGDQDSLGQEFLLSSS
ncbi:hypothetical protein CUMW_247180 [Citrus unshiu]|uniref:Uncharacterized protein n=1 Tax=Citrus unshiu TaxID=55188 RepID=A0A2H5QNR8_CITUN|nr:hypothetical protein CUMW_247180 [Citrus unshiu]